MRKYVDYSDNFCEVVRLIFINEMGPKYSLSQAITLAFVFESIDKTSPMEKNVKFMNYFILSCITSTRAPSASR